MGTVPTPKETSNPILAGNRANCLEVEVVNCLIEAGGRHAWGICRRGWVVAGALKGFRFGDGCGFFHLLKAVGLIPYGCCLFFFF